MTGEAKFTGVFFVIQRINNRRVRVSLKNMKPSFQYRPVRRGGDVSEMTGIPSGKSGSLVSVLSIIWTGSELNLVLPLLLAHAGPASFQVIKPFSV